MIIPTSNSEETIARCLNSIKTGTYKNVELIVVDNHSVDNTMAIAKKCKAKVLLLRSERSAAKNYGAANAAGRYLFFVDSDMELTPHVIEECVNMCLKENVDAVTVPEVSIAKNFLARCKKIEKSLYASDPNFFDMPRFFNKRIFDAVEGFDENLVHGEDFDLGRRVEKAGYKIGRCRAKIKHHEGKLFMKKIALKACYYGKTLPAFIGKNPSSAFRGYCPTRFLRNIKPLLRQYPVYFIVLLAIKLVEYMAYITGVISAKLT